MVPGHLRPGLSYIVMAEIWRINIQIFNKQIPNQTIQNVWNMTFGKLLLSLFHFVYLIPGKAIIAQYAVS